MSTGYELEDDKYDKYMEALGYKLEELGVDSANQAEVFQVMKDWWYILTDEAAIQVYIDSIKTAQLQAQKTALEEALANVEAQLS